MFSSPVVTSGLQSEISKVVLQKEQRGTLFLDDQRKLIRTTSLDGFLSFESD